MRKLFFLLLALPLAFAACETTPDTPQEQPKGATLELTSNPTMEFDADGGQGNITFLYDGNNLNTNINTNPSTGRVLTVECDADWISVASEIDVLAERIPFSVEANSQTEPREATIKASIKELVIEVLVKQAAYNEPTNEYIEGWAINGTMNNWEKSEATPMTEEGNYFVAKQIALTSNDNFNFIFDGGIKNYGGNGQASEPNYAYEAKSWGSNISVSLDGEYDIYLSADLEHYYIMTPGMNPEEAEEAIKPGEKRWSIYGTFEGNNRDSDIILASDGKYLVARGVKFTGECEFVVRCNGGDEATLGATEDSTFTPEQHIIIVNGGSAIKVDVDKEQRYDIYFIAGETSSDLWVMPEGQYPIIWNRVDGTYMPGYNNFLLYLITNDIVLTLDFTAGSETVVNYVIPAGTYTFGDTEGTGWCFDQQYCIAKVRGHETPLLDGKMTIEHKDGKYDIYVDMRTATLDVLKMHYVGEIGFDPFFANMGGLKLNSPEK